MHCTYTLVFAINQGMEGGAVKDPRLESRDLGSSPGCAPQGTG